MKILLLDIETSPHTVFAWGLFKQNISLSQVQDTSRVLCASYKWLGDKKTHFVSEWKEGVDEMLKELYNVIEEADVIVTYNGNRFDLPTLNKEFLLNGYTPPAPYKSVDLYRTVKTKFRFASNKLDHVAQELGLGGKTSHYGFQMWVDVMDGNRKAQKLMEQYNKQDVILLEKVYGVVLPWIPNHPNHSHSIKENVMTKIDKVIKALRSSQLTRKQIASRFKVPNVRAILFDIKRKGYQVSFLLKGNTEYIRIANAA